MVNERRGVSTVEYFYYSPFNIVHEFNILVFFLKYLEKKNFRKILQLLVIHVTRNI